MTYRTECLSCIEKTGKSGKIYIGESGRSAFERGKEHEKDFENEKEDSHMLKHWEEDHHNENKPKFSMKVLRAHTSALARQVHEAVLIEMNSEIVLNSKGEYNRCQLPRLGVKMGERNMEDSPPEKEMTDAELLDAIKEDRKRVENENEIAQPSSKRRKIRTRKPEMKLPTKRTREIEPNKQVSKKLRMNSDGYECLLPKKHGSWKASSRPVPVNSLSILVNTKPASKTSNDGQEISNSNNLLKYFQIATPNTNQSQIQTQQNLSSPNTSVRNLISFFERNCPKVSKPREHTEAEVKQSPTTFTELMKTKPEHKANSTPSLTLPTTTKLNNKPGLRKKSKLVPPTKRKKSKLLPPNFNYLKISDHFQTKVKVNPLPMPAIIINEDEMSDESEDATIKASSVELKVSC